MSRSTAPAVLPEPVEAETSYVEPARVKAEKHKAGAAVFGKFFQRHDQQQLNSGFRALQQNAEKSRMLELAHAEERAGRLRAANAEADRRGEQHRLKSMRGPFAAIKQEVLAKKLSESFAKRRLAVIERATVSGRNDGCVDISDVLIQAKLVTDFNDWVVAPQNLASVDAALHAAIEVYKSGGYKVSVAGFSYDLKPRHRAAEIDGMVSPEVAGTIGTLGIITKLLQKGEWKGDGHLHAGAGKASLNMVLFSMLLKQYGQDRARQLEMGELANHGGEAFQLVSTVLGTDFIRDSDLTHGLFMRSPLTSEIKGWVPEVPKAMVNAKELAASYFEAESANIAQRIRRWVLEPRNHAKVASVLSRCVGIYETRALAAGDRSAEIKVKFEQCIAREISPVLWLGILMGTGSWVMPGHLGPGAGYESFNMLAMTELFQAYAKDMAYDLATGVKPGTGAHNLQDLELWLTCAKHPQEFQVVAKTVFDNAGFVMIKPEDYAPVEKHHAATQTGEVGASESKQACTP
ncbi:MAG: hypothetical protein P1U63_03245 [Coxiellaceae bacterium]|nr:hypothetical protein [Coxiellaceae bacterium]